MATPDVSTLRPPRRGLLQPAADYQMVAGLFLRLLGLIYIAAFASLAVQITGLAGSQGILPVTDLLRDATATYGQWRYLRLPTLFWIDASDLALQATTVAGVVCGLLLALNVLPRLMLVLLFVLYLSLFQAGQVFMNFQWDYLLLEAGFLGIFLPGGSRIVIWLYRWLLFRLRFLSGASKLLSGDPSWSGLTALNFYFETQPLPHVGSWYAHQLPEWLLRAGTGAALFTELVVPFMMFLPRPWRLFAAWATILMQLLIILTSNHNFFNLLTLALCLFLFDDQALRRILPGMKGYRFRLAPRPLRPALAPVRALLLGGTATLLVVVSGSLAAEMFLGRRAPEPLATLEEWTFPYQLAHRYHVFPTITTERLELVVEGSTDGVTWKRYPFRYKPGDPLEAPRFIVPHQPRLDWMAWFVPLGHPMNARWYNNFLQRLREGSPEVLALLRENPFLDGPPRYLRASLWQYRFTAPATRDATGAWWTVTYRGPFLGWPPQFP